MTTFVYYDARTSTSLTFDPVFLQAVPTFETSPIHSGSEFVWDGEEPDFLKWENNSALLNFSETGAIQLPDYGIPNGQITTNSSNWWQPGEQTLGPLRYDIVESRQSYNGTSYSLDYYYDIITFSNSKASSITVQEINEVFYEDGGGSYTSFGGYYTLNSGAAVPLSDLIGPNSNLMDTPMYIQSRQDYDPDAVSAEVKIYGGHADDFINGGFGAELIVGRGGNDKLDGFQLTLEDYLDNESDTLIGGEGDDCFVLRPHRDLTVLDVIEDFSLGDTIEAKDATSSFVTFTKGIIYEGDGADLGDGETQIQVFDDHTLLHIGTDDVAGADITARLNGDFSKIDFEARLFDIVLLPTIAEFTENADTINFAEIANEGRGFLGNPYQALAGHDDVWLPNSDAAAALVDVDGEPLEFSFDTMFEAGAGEDTITGVFAPYVNIDGGPDNDAIYGSGGADYLDGGSGQDEIQGGNGADTLSGGYSLDAFTNIDDGDIDTLSGGADTDSYIVGVGDKVEEMEVGEVAHLLGSEKLATHFFVYVSSGSMWMGVVDDGIIPTAVFEVETTFNPREMQVNLGSPLGAVFERVATPEKHYTSTEAIDAAVAAAKNQVQQFRIQSGIDFDSALANGAKDQASLISSYLLSKHGKNPALSVFTESFFDIQSAQDLIQTALLDYYGYYDAADAPIAKSVAYFNAIAGLVPVLGTAVQLGSVIVTNFVDTLIDVIGGTFKFIVINTGPGEYGEEGDFVFGSAEDDQANLNGGDDEYSGFDGNDSVNGGLGDDTLVGGAGNDRLFGDEGNDRLDGGGGFDRLNGGSGDDTMLGGNGHDKLRGSSGDDYLGGMGGRDVLNGGGGADFLNGGGGNDKLKGGAGQDHLVGGGGRDLLKAGGGEDYLEGGNGRDILFGGAKADVFIFDPSHSGADRIMDFNDGVDLIDLTRFDLSEAPQVLDGEWGAEVFVGGERVAIVEDVEAAVLGSDDFLI